MSKYFKDLVLSITLGSAFVAAQNVVFADDLVVTEVMYNAPDGNPFDYIELKNNSLDTVELNGYAFVDGIEFDFSTSSLTSLAAGEYLVVVDDLDSFNATYSVVGVKIAGEYSGDLSNGGEDVELSYLGSSVISFAYNDSRNWPLAADGAGHSLVPLESAIETQEEGSLDYGGNWRASSENGGSPGVEDPEFIQTVLINEVIAHTDTDEDEPFDSNDSIELFNTTNETVDIGGWSFSDDLEFVDAYVIPNGTTIAAGGFIVFDEDDFHSDRVEGFGLNKAGEQVYLRDDSLAIVDAVAFKGQENGASWGRFPDGDNIWIAASPTEGEENEPFEFPFWISSVMYHPADPGGDELEYIVIENISSASASLESEIGVYRIDGGVEFDFPEGVTLDAGEEVWVVSFDPTDATLEASFKAEYGLESADQLFGPYEGVLSNRTDRVALERPQESDDPDLPNDISWVVVDELFYFDRDPWPSDADGDGAALVRLGTTSWSSFKDPDSDNDGIDDDWERDYFGTLVQLEPDVDQDGWSNLEEYIADTDPTDGSSFLSVEIDGAGALLWNASSDRVYSVYWTDDLDTDFTEVATGLTEGAYVDQERTGDSFYRVKVEL
ncbi:lamin tail domain-containing protein [Puniceicoccaceae bacterium K14]|nr:lamin tail domain-containing protein [Puniceicoccaceae bacterium K14]